MKPKVIDTLTDLTVFNDWESSKPILCSKWGHFDRAKTILKILLASWTFDTVWKGFRSFNAENLMSVDWRIAKLLAIKLCACTLFGRTDRKVRKRKIWRLLTWNPLICRSKIFSIKRSKPFTNCVKSSRGYQNFMDGFFPVKFNSFTT